MSGYKNTSPAKKLRSLKRLFTFVQSKVSLVDIDIMLKLTPTKLPSTSYIPATPSLNLTKNQSISIPPRRIYHLAIINACQAMFRKHLLSKEEVNKFNKYKEFKLQGG